MTVSTGVAPSIFVAAAMLTFAAPAAAQEALPSSAAPEESAVAPAADGHLARILDAGVIRMSTDPAYPPQSELKDGVIVGFDIDVGTEIADRLGVDLVLETPTSRSWLPAPGAIAGTSAWAP